MPACQVAYLPGCDAIHLTYVSESLDQSAFAAQCVVEKAAESLSRDYEEWTRVKTLSLWCDCGHHFRGGVFMGFALVTLPRVLGVDVDLNYFIEKHGKSVVDAWFRVIAWFAEQHLRSLEQEPNPKGVPQGFFAAKDAVAALKAQSNKHAPGFEERSTGVPLKPKRPFKPRRPLASPYR